MSALVPHFRSIVARRVLSRTAVALSLVLVASSSWAQDELDDARALYREGLSLQVAGNWAQALARFERVASVRLTPQVRFHMARCKEHLGRMTEALGEYRMSEYEAERDALKELPEIREAREALEARIPKVKITRGPGAEQAVIELDGVELGESSVGADLTLDPGPHRVAAHSPGKTVFRQSFQADERTQTLVEIVLEELPESNEPPPSQLVMAGPDEVALEPTLSVGPWPFVWSGVALVGAGAGAYFLYERSNAIDVQKQHCIGAVCDAAFSSEVRDAEGDEARNGVLSISAFSVSAVALGTAVYLFLDDDEPATTAISVRSGVLPGGFGLDVGGTF